MENLLVYATDDSPPRSSFAESPYALPASSSKVMKAARLQLGGSAPAYPGLMDTMSRLMQSNYRLRVEEADGAAEADIVWMNVAGEPGKDDPAVGELMTAIRAGKFALIDLVGGSPDWDEAFQAMLKDVEPGLALEKLARNDPMFTGAIAGTQGFDVIEVQLRKSLHTRFSKSGRCDLYALLKDGKRVGVYSAHDLSSGAGFHMFPGCRGPMPDDAREVAMNAFLAAYAWKLGDAVVQQ